MAQCSVDKCEDRLVAHGLCSMHYQRVRRTGTTQPQLAHRQRQDKRWMHRGYVMVYRPLHPNASATGAMLEHRYVMAEHLGRALAKDETVHHVNGDKMDNRIENLELWSTRHQAGQRVADLTVWALEHLARYAPEAMAV